MAPANTYLLHPKDGYPVLFDINLSNERLSWLLAFLKEGSYLSGSRTTTLTAQMVAYNSVLRAYGYAKVSFSWSAGGQIKAKVLVKALEYKDYTLRGLAQKKMQMLLLVDIALILIVTWYLYMATVDVYLSVAHQIKDRKARRIMAEHGISADGEEQKAALRAIHEEEEHDEHHDHSDSKLDAMKSRKFKPKAARYHAQMTPFWMVYEIALCSIMITAVALSFLYAVGLSQTVPTEIRYNVYDASSFAAARPLMLKRLDTLDKVQASSTKQDAINLAAMAGITNSFEIQALQSAMLSEPVQGQAGRWKMTEDRTGLDQVASFYNKIEELYTQLMLYGICQMVVLTMSMIRMMTQTSFQARLSVISGTISRALPDMSSFAVTFACIGLPLGVIFYLLYGTHFESCSSIARVTPAMYGDMLFGQWEDSEQETALTETIRDSLNSDSTVEALVSILLFIMRPLFLLFLLSFMMAMLQWPYTELSLGARGLPGVPQDFKMLLKWFIETRFKGAPRNKRIDELIDKVLEKHNKRLMKSFMDAVHRRYINTYMPPSNGKVAFINSRTSDEAQRGSLDENTVTVGGNTFNSRALALAKALTQHSSLKSSMKSSMKSHGSARERQPGGEHGVPGSGDSLLERTAAAALASLQGEEAEDEAEDKDLDEDREMDRGHDHSWRSDRNAYSREGKDEDQPSKNSYLPTGNSSRLASRGILRKSRHPSGNSPTSSRALSRQESSLTEATSACARKGVSFISQQKHTATAPRLQHSSTLSDSPDSGSEDLDDPGRKSALQLLRTAPEQVREGSPPLGAGPSDRVLVKPGSLTAQPSVTNPPGQLPQARGEQEALGSPFHGNAQQGRMVMSFTSPVHPLDIAAEIEKSACSARSQTQWGGGKRSMLRRISTAIYAASHKEDQPDPTQEEALALLLQRAGGQLMQSLGDNAMRGGTARRGYASSTSKVRIHRDHKEEKGEEEPKEGAKPKPLKSAFPSRKLKTDWSEDLSRAQYKESQDNLEYRITIERGQPLPELHSTTTTVDPVPPSETGSPTTVDPAPPSETGSPTREIAGLPKERTWNKVYSSQQPAGPGSTESVEEVEEMIMSGQDDTTKELAQSCCSFTDEASPASRLPLLKLSNLSRVSGTLHDALHDVASFAGRSFTTDEANSVSRTTVLPFEHSSAAQRRASEAGSISSPVIPVRRQSVAGFSPSPRRLAGPMDAAAVAHRRLREQESRASTLSVQDISISGVFDGPLTVPMTGPAPNITTTAVQKFDQQDKLGPAEDSLQPAHVYPGFASMKTKNLRNMRTLREGVTQLVQQATAMAVSIMETDEHVHRMVKQLEGINKARGSQAKCFSNTLDGASTKAPDVNRVPVLDLATMIENMKGEERNDTNYGVHIPSALGGDIGSPRSLVATQPGLHSTQLSALSPLCPPNSGFMSGSLMATPRGSFSCGHGSAASPFSSGPVMASSSPVMVKNGGGGALTLDDVTGSFSASGRQRRVSENVAPGSSRESHGQRQFNSESYQHAQQHYSSQQPSANARSSSDAQWEPARQRIASLSGFRDLQNPLLRTRPSPDTVYQDAASLRPAFVPITEVQSQLDSPSSCGLSSPAFFGSHNRRLRPSTVIEVPSLQSQADLSPGEVATARSEAGKVSHLHSRSEALPGSARSGEWSVSPSADSPSEIPRSGISLSGIPRSGISLSGISRSGNSLSGITRSGNSLSGISPSGSSLSGNLSPFRSILSGSNLSSRVSSSSSASEAPSSGEGKSALPLNPFRSRVPDSPGSPNPASKTELRSSPPSGSNPLLGTSPKGPGSSKNIANPPFANPKLRRPSTLMPIRENHSSSGRFASPQPDPSEGGTRTGSVFSPTSQKKPSPYDPSPGPSHPSFSGNSSKSTSTEKPASPYPRPRSRLDPRPQQASPLRPTSSSDLSSFLQAVAGRASGPSQQVSPLKPTSSSDLSTFLQTVAGRASGPSQQVSNSPSKSARPPSSQQVNAASSRVQSSGPTLTLALALCLTLCLALCLKGTHPDSGSGSVSDSLSGSVFEGEETGLQSHILLPAILGTHPDSGSGSVSDSLSGSVFEGVYGCRFLPTASLQTAPPADVPHNSIIMPPR
eukprot:gene13652-19539_t